MMSATMLTAPTVNRHGAATQNPIAGTIARARGLRAAHRSETVPPRSIPANAAALNVIVPYTPAHLWGTPSSVWKNVGNHPRSGQYAAPFRAFMASSRRNPPVVRSAANAPAGRGAPAGAVGCDGPAGGCGRKIISNRA